MKKLITLLLFASSFAAATDTKVFLAGAAAGIAVYGYGPTRNHVIRPAAHFVQRTIRPVPQDKIDAANRRAARAAKKEARSAAHAQHRRKGDH